MDLKMHDLVTKLRTAALVGTLALAACSSPNDDSVMLGLNGEPAATIYLAKGQGNDSVFVASGAPEAESMRYCLTEANVCQSTSWVDLEPMNGPTARRYFGLKHFTPDATKTYRLEVTLKNGTADIRDFALVTAGASGAWKAVFMSSDYEDNGNHIVAWDNGRRDLSKLLMARGFSPTTSRQLSQDPTVRSQEKAGEGDLTGLTQAFTELAPGANDRCFLFMTSHGSRSSFYVEGGQGISPDDFATLLDRQCGDRPTVAFISACYAGIMVTPETAKPNRIIFTAASAQKTSQGCAPGITYNLFEECAIGSINKAKTFTDWGKAIKSCIEAKDQSDPVFFIGANMQSLAIAGDAAPSVQPNAGGQQPPSTPTPSAMTGARNLALVGPDGAIDLQAALGGARYALIDFSQPSCGYCVQFAAMMEEFSPQLSGQGAESCRAVTIVGRSQLDAWVRNAEAGGARDAKLHSFALTNSSHGEALGALEGTAAQGSVPTPTILFMDTKTGEVIKKSVGAMDRSAVSSLLGAHCK